MTAKPHSAWAFSLKDGFLLAAAVIIALRLTIWKFLPSAEVFVREDLSNLIVAGLSFFLFLAVLLKKLLLRESWQTSGFAWPLAIMTAAAGMSIIYTVDRSASITAFVVFVAAVVFFLTLCDLLDTPRRIKYFGAFMLVFAVVTAAYAVREFFMLSARQPLASDAQLAEYNTSLYYVLTRRRATSFLGWPNSLAAYLLLFIPLAGVWAWKTRAWWGRLVLGSVFVVLLAGFLATFSFMGWTNLLLASLGMAPIVFKRLGGRLSSRQRIAVILGFCLFLVLFGWVVSRKNFTGAITPRKIYYRDSLALIAEHPFRGHGFGAYGTAVRPLVTIQDGLTAYPHNTYLQWQVETGVAGLVGILLFVWSFIRTAGRAMARYPDGEYGWLVIAWIWGMTAFLIDNFVSFTFIKPNISWHGWAMLAALAAMGRPQAVLNLPKFRGLWLQYLAGAGAVVLLGVIVFLASAFICYQAGVSARSANDLGRAGKAFMRASRLDPWSPAYPAASGVVLIDAYRATGRVDFLQGSIASFEAAKSRAPRNYSNYFILSEIYTALGKKDQAARESAYARKFSPFEYGREIRRQQESAGSSR